MKDKKMFLPINKKEMLDKGWEQPDFIIVSGDAYVDHPSFGAAIISRTLERYGYKVCMICQPDWKKIDSFKIFGEPRLGFMVTGYWWQH
jgi:Radical SAM N-terminal.